MRKNKETKGKKKTSQSVDKRVHLIIGLKEEKRKEEKRKKEKRNINKGVKTKLTGNARVWIANVRAIEAIDEY